MRGEARFTVWFYGSGYMGEGYWVLDWVLVGEQGFLFMQVGASYCAIMHLFVYC